MLLLLALVTPDLLNNTSLMLRHSCPTLTAEAVSPTLGGGGLGWRVCNPMQSIHIYRFAREMLSAALPLRLLKKEMPTAENRRSTVAADYGPPPKVYVTSSTLEGYCDTTQRIFKLRFSFLTLNNVKAAQPRNNVKESGQRFPNARPLP